MSSNPSAHSFTQSMNTGSSFIEDSKKNSPIFKLDPTDSRESFAYQYPLSLKKTIQIAKEKNLFLQAEKYNIDSAKAGIITAKTLRNPTFNSQELIRGGSLGTQYQTIPTTNGFGLVQTFSGAYSRTMDWRNRQDWLQITYLFPVANQRRYSIELAIRNLQIAHNNYLDFQRDIIYLVACKWIDVWFSHEKINILRKAKRFTNDLLQVNELRLKNQVITPTEYQRTQIIAEQYNAFLATGELEYSNELRKLKALLGFQEDILIDFEDSWFIDTPIEDYNTLYEFALKNRADLNAMKSEQEAAIANINLQEANAYPRPEAGFIYNPQNSTPYYGTYLTMPLPLFDRNQGEIKRSKALFQQKVTKYEGMVLNLKTEIHSAIHEFKVAQENYDKYKNIFRNAEKVLDTVQYSYLKGGTTIIDFIEAQRSWFDTQNLYYNSIYVYRRSYMQLLYVTGKISDY